MAGEAMTLTADDILKANDRQMEAVKAWGGTVYVRTMTGLERDEWEEACSAGKREDGTVDVRGVMARLIVRCACAADGALLFKPAQADALNQKAAPELMAVYRVALRLNKLGQDDIEEMAGN